LFNPRLNLPAKCRLHGVESLDGHRQGSGSRAVWRFIDHLVSDVPLLRRRQQVDEPLEVDFPDDHLVQWQAVSVGKHGLAMVGVGVIGDGVVLDKCNRELPGILLGDVHAPADTPGDVADAPSGLGRINAKKATPWKSGNRPICLVLVVGASCAWKGSRNARQPLERVFDSDGLYC